MWRGSERAIWYISYFYIIVSISILFKTWSCYFIRQRILTQFLKFRSAFLEIELKSWIQITMLKIVFLCYLEVEVNIEQIILTTWFVSFDVSESMQNSQLSPWRKFPLTGTGDELNYSKDTLSFFWGTRCTSMSRWLARNRDGCGTEEEGDAHWLWRAGGYSPSSQMYLAVHSFIYSFNNVLLWAVILLSSRLTS